MRSRYQRSQDRIRAVRARAQEAWVSPADGVTRELIDETIQGLWRIGATCATPPAPVDDRMFFAVGVVLGIDPDDGASWPPAITSPTDSPGDSPAYLPASPIDNEETIVVYDEPELVVRPSWWNQEFAQIAETIQKEADEQGQQLRPLELEFKTFLAWGKEPRQTDEVTQRPLRSGLPETDWEWWQRREAANGRIEELPN